MTFARGSAWLLGALLVLAVPACGDSSTPSSDAAIRSDADAPAATDVPLIKHDTALPTLDVAGKDLATEGKRDTRIPDLAPTSLDTAPDQPVGTFDGGGPLDAGAERGATDVALDAAPRDATPGVDATSVDATVDPNLSFCSGLQSVDAGVAQRRCYDFGDPTGAADFVPEAGTWMVTNGTYTVVGPQNQVTCPDGDGSLMTASVLSNLSAKDVRVHAKLTAISSPDKVIVLRSRPNGNRIELNFRSNFVFEDVAQGGDLYIAALVDCTAVAYVPVATVLIPHAIGQTIVADVQLIGQNLTVAVDGKTVFDGNLPVPTEPGTVGLATFREAVTQFDELVVDVLD